jgi:hypothetical protein
MTVLKPNNNPASTRQKSFPARLRTRFSKLSVPWGALVEILLIELWAIWVGSSLLNFNPNQFPTGDEFPISIQSNYIWNLLPRCGACVLWNGFSNGGTPAFVDPYGAMLHPLVIISTALWGQFNGGKVLFILSLFMGGLAQWWMAHTMRLRMPVRMWAAAMAVVGGSLAGRMQNGDVNLAFSTASAALVIAALLNLIFKRSGLSIVLFGVVLSLAFLSGQGYMQIGAILIILAAVLVFGIRENKNRRRLWKPLGLGLLIAALLAGIFFVPFLHFLPQFQKEIDVALSAYQHLAYSPLNLVINDFNFFNTKVLSKYSIGHTYFNYVGWIPVLLAFLSLRFVPSRHRRYLIFFFLSIFLLYFFSSSEVMRFLMKFIPPISGLRSMQVIEGLAVPLIVGLAAWSVNLIMNFKWWQIHIQIIPGKPWQFSGGWLILAVPLLSALVSDYQFSHEVMGETNEHTASSKVISLLQTPSSEWIAAPFENYNWIPPLMAKSMKIAYAFRPWHWKGRDFPNPFIETSTDPHSVTQPGYLQYVDGYFMIKNPENEYAQVISNSDGKLYPCQAEAFGGNINVSCDESTPAGILVVHENSWSGWSVKVDGKPQALLKDQWLRTEAPAGMHTYSFRYRPWDVPVGIFVSLCGIILSVFILVRRNVKGSKPIQ